MTSIIDRIKKLLRLARDKAATPAEAGNALNRALELIQQHEIDIATLDLDEPTEKLVCERIHVGQAVSFIKRRVNLIVIHYFRVRTIWERPDLAVVGFETDVTIAGYVFAFLVRACSQALKDYVAAERKGRRKVTTRKKQSFIQGWMYGVATTLRDPDAPCHEIQDSKTALIIAEKKSQVDKHFEQLFPDCISSPIRKKPFNKTALWHGYRRGKDTSITTPHPRHRNTEPPTSIKPTMEKKLKVMARVQVTVEIETGAWSGDCFISQLYKQAAEKGAQKVVDALQAAKCNARIIADPNVIGVITEQP